MRHSLYFDSVSRDGPVSLKPVDRARVSQPLHGGVDPSRRWRRRDDRRAIHIVPLQEPSRPVEVGRRGQVAELARINAKIVIEARRQLRRRSVAAEPIGAQRVDRYEQYRRECSSRGSALCILTARTRRAAVPEPEVAQHEGQRPRGQQEVYEQRCDSSLA
jgi:hypothetical protein